MRRWMIISFISFLFLGLGSLSKAEQLDFKASGFIDAAYFAGKNVPYSYDLPTWVPINGWLPPIYGPSPLFDVSAPGRGVALDKNRNFWGSRMRLKFDAIMSKELSGTVFFEGDSGMWGEGGAGGRNQMGRWGGDQAALEIKNVYIDFGIPPVIPVPMTARVGIQTLAVRPHMVALSDGPGITMGIKIDPVMLKPLWFKVVENEDFASDDVDIYGLDVTASLGIISIGGFALYYNQNTYPIIPAAPTSENRFKSDMWWLGVYADGKVGPFNTNFDFVVDTGKVEDSRAGGARAPDVDYRGWATRLKLDLPVEKFNFGGVGMYASGSDQKKTDGGTSVVGNGGLPGNVTPWGTPTRKVSGYMVPTASEQFPFGESIIISGNPIWTGFFGYNVLNYTQMHRGSIGGTWVGKLYGSYKVTPSYKVTLAGIYIGDTTKNGNTLGTARKSIGSGIVIPGQPLPGVPRDDQSIGFEFDLINEVSIYKNLKFDIGFGYLFAGKALDYFDQARNRNVSGDDPWVVATRLTYSF